MKKKGICLRLQVLILSWCQPGFPAEGDSGQAATEMGSPLRAAADFQPDMARPSAAEGIACMQSDVHTAA